ncbi:hypothetical protein OAL09_08235 [Verrucomicrobia bacterium]|jgi:hypothetical protein|nr:hypothetical protein [Verrucomicrobiota bacterium]|tara:strand:- start:296 stop:514 length:219 start_codon:yes stop_codon:yes gene_type:complete
MMKKSKQFVSVFLLAIALVIPSLGEEKSKVEKSNKVAAALKGKLIEFKGDKIADGEISAKVDYYVLYHSASW